MGWFRLRVAAPRVAGTPGGASANDERVACSALASDARPLRAACFAVVLASRVACAAEASGAVGSDAGGFGFGNLVRFSASDGPRVPEAARLGAVPEVAPADDVRRGRLFPEDFAFGVASSAFQIEGDGGDRPRSTWDDFSDARGLGDAARRGIRHFERVEDDIKYMASGGEALPPLPVLAAAAERDGTPNDAGHAFYEKMLETARARNRAVRHAAPLGFARGDVHIPQSIRERRRNVTLACPARVSRGGLARSRVVSQFESYAAQAFARLGGGVRFWATLNEPKTVANLGYGVGQHAPGLVSATAPLRAGHNMLLARGGGAECTASGSATNHPGARGSRSTSTRIGASRARERDARDVATRRQERWTRSSGARTPCIWGLPPASMKARYGRRFTPRSVYSSSEKRSLKGSTDFFALNHYASAYVVDAGSVSAANSYLGRPVDWAERDTNKLGDRLGPTGNVRVAETGAVRHAQNAGDDQETLRRPRRSSPKTACVPERRPAPASARLWTTERVAVRARLPQGGSECDRAGRRGRARVLRVVVLR